MRRATTLLLTVAGFLAVNQAATLKSRTASNLQAPPQFHQGRELVQVAAAAMLGGEGQMFAELQDQAANAVA